MVARLMAGALSREPTYGNRHGIFTKAEPDDAKPTQFKRALLQPAIEPTRMHSSRARGCVERLFQTLRDRISKDMRISCTTLGARPIDGS